MRKLTFVMIAGCGIVVMLASTVVRRVNTASNGDEWRQLELYAQRDGKREAERDWSDGRPRWITYGGPAFDLRPGDEVLRRKLGVIRDHIAYCAVPPAAEEYTSSYNRVIWLKLVDLCGEGYVRDALVEASVSPWSFENEQAKKGLELYWGSRGENG